MAQLSILESRCNGCGAFIAFVQDEDAEPEWGFPCPNCGGEDWEPITAGFWEEYDEEGREGLTAQHGSFAWETQDDQHNRTGGGTGQR